MCAPHSAPKPCEEIASSAQISAIATTYPRCSKLPLARCASAITLSTSLSIDSSKILRIVTIKPESQVVPASGQVVGCQERRPEPASTTAPLIEGTETDAR